ncbi:hypothetical protein D1007_47995 [Hordeum vulgare]|nr:hypothetical protein D1007_47995 [Hordeum vulgare]
MAPASKQKPETQGPALAPPLLECALSKDADLTPVLPWTAAESNEHGRTLIWPGATAKRTATKAVYPFFLHSIFAGLVPPFSSFFTAILNHYGIQALHLQPQLHLTRVRLCFLLRGLPAEGSNLLLKAGKKVENFRHRWVLMSLKEANPGLEMLKGLPEKTSAWSSAKLSDPRAAPILERFSRDISAKRLTGGMIV